MTTQTAQVRQLMHKAYEWQKANQTRWVIRSTGKRRYLKATDWERGVFGLAWRPHGVLPMNRVI